jgi:aerobic-type carbon monoxide dehydrogenase small subunit (CoxS/CutS family)
VHASAGTAFLEVARRHGDYAMCGVAALVGLDYDGRIRTARTAYVSMGPTPVVLDLTDELAGDLPDAARWADAAKFARSHLQPDEDIHASAEYRAELSEVLTRRALAAAAAHVRRAPSPTGTGRDPMERRPSRRPRSTMQTVETAAADTRVATIRVNGVPHDIAVAPRRLLSDCLRHDLGLTGTHVGCEHGVCGCCTVLLDGAPVRSCLLLAVALDGHEITTIEGCANPDGSLGPVQQAFWECHGLQCGFCTPGFVTTVTAFLNDHPDPTEADAVEAISGNLCRCTGYQNIVRSVLRAAEIRRELQHDGPA